MPTGRLQVSGVEAGQGKLYRDDQYEKNCKGGSFGEPADCRLSRRFRRAAGRGAHKGVIFSWMRLLIVLTFLAIELVKVSS